MSHLDEGTLHALLDGELDLAEVSEIQKHLGSCVACGSRLQEVKQVLAEADRLVGAMEVPASAPRSRPEPRSEPLPPPSRPAHEPLAWDEPPVLLVPDPIDAHATRRRWIRGLAMAAVLGGVLAGGKLIGRALQPSHPMLSDRDLTSVSQPTAQSPVVSPEESRKPESKLATREPKQSRTQAPRAPAPVPPPTPAPAKVAVDTSSLAANQEDSAAADSAAADSAALAETAGDSAVDVAAAAGATSAAQTERSSSDADALATRRAAAAALAELDRERQRQRANAATAALPPARVEAEPEPAPRPPTLEQRSQVYMRIGLDEAVKQLGGPVHVIEGMTPELIGLTRTQLIPGTTSNRPVVRVVYVDNRGRLILLDQQRMASGQALSAPAGSLRWAIGDVMLYLRGEPSPDLLRSLQARVR
ncbi:MAG: anti-sigma factor family protein [Gemmatimonadales bacterium]